MLFARWIYNWSYVRSTVSGALGRKPAFKFTMPFGMDVLRWLARAILLFAMMFIGL
jgi:hypothetical protein